MSSCRGKYLPIWYCWLAYNLLLIYLFACRLVEFLFSYSSNSQILPQYVWHGYLLTAFNWNLVTLHVYIFRSLVLKKFSSVTSLFLFILSSGFFFWAFLRLRLKSLFSLLWSPLSTIFLKIIFRYFSFSVFWAGFMFISSLFDFASWMGAHFSYSSFISILPHLVFSTHRRFLYVHLILEAFCSQSARDWSAIHLIWFIFLLDTHYTAFLRPS